MTNEKSVNVDEITSASKIKLVVTDIASELSEAAPAATSGGLTSEASIPATPPATAPSESNATSANEIADPDKVMRDLPVDEFFRVLEQSTPEQLQKLIHTFEKGARTKGGTKLLQKVIEVPKEPRSALSILLWWEWRRPLYNIAVGLAGLPSVIAIALFFGTPFVVAVLCGLFFLFWANICYSLGTPAEMVARTCYKDNARTYGPVLLTLGTIFSVVLTIVLELIVLAFLSFGAFRFF